MDAERHGATGGPGRKGSALLLAAGGVLACALSAAAAPPPVRAQEPPGARPPPDDGAVRRDLLGRAIADGSNGALILFLARYPADPDAETVRGLLATRRQPDPAPLRGPDGAIVAAFDRARLDGPAALGAFAARYPTHPLAAEARLWSQRAGTITDGRDNGPDNGPDGEP